MLRLAIIRSLPERTIAISIAIARRPRRRGARRWRIAGFRSIAIRCELVDDQLDHAQENVARHLGLAADPFLDVGGLHPEPPGERAAPADDLDRLLQCTPLYARSHGRSLPNSATRTIAPVAPIFSGSF